MLRHSSNMRVETHVEALPLHEIVGPGDLFGARLIKIDVEGVEINVFRGMTGVLHQYQPILLYEIDDGDWEAFKHKRDMFPKKNILKNSAQLEEKKQIFIINVSRE